MQDDGERDGAAGIVGVRVGENNHVSGGHGVEFAAATRRHDRRARPEPPGPGCPPRSARPT